MDAKGHIEEDEILRLANEWMDAVRRKDLETLESLGAPEYALQAPGIGRMPREQCLEEHACFGGTVGSYAHHSSACDAEMRFAVYVPPQAAEGLVPTLYYLAGLTSTEETFMTKGGAQRVAAEHGLMLVAPDTSPRGLGLPGEDDDSDFGSGAGFYLDATAEPWSRHYRMGTYVTRELPAVVAEHFPASGTRGIFGHSMGGHGALTLALKTPDLYASVSAFARSPPRPAPPGERRLFRATWVQTERPGASTTPASSSGEAPSPMAAPSSSIRARRISSSTNSSTPGSSKRPAKRRASR